MVTKIHQQGTMGLSTKRIKTKKVALSLAQKILLRIIFRSFFFVTLLFYLFYAVFFFHVFAFVHHSVVAFFIVGHFGGVHDTIDKHGANEKNTWIFLEQYV